MKIKRRKQVEDLGIALSNSVRTVHFWNKLHHVHSKIKRLERQVS